METTSLIRVHVNSTKPLDIPDVFRHNTDDEDFADYVDWMAYGTQATVLYVPAGAKEAYAKADYWKDFGFILEPTDDDSFVASLKRDAVEIDGVAYQINGVKGIARAAQVLEDTKKVYIKDVVILGDRTLNVTTMHPRFFIDCNIMSDCYISAMTPPTLSESFTSTNIHMESTLHVPKGTKDLYAVAVGWKDFRRIVDDASTTAIQGVTDVNGLQSTESWYTLDGRRLGAEPTKPGLYIHNGKKLVIK